jgi:hypothetical protein
MEAYGIDTTDPVIFPRNSRGTGFQLGFNDLPRGKNTA